LNSLKELFDGMFLYNFTQEGVDDSEIFPIFKAGINNLSSKKDQDEMYDYFKENYIKVWIDSAKEEEDPSINLNEEQIEAEKTFLKHWKGK